MVAERVEGDRGHMPGGCQARTRKTFEMAGFAKTEVRTGNLENRSNASKRAADFDMISCIPP